MSIVKEFKEFAMRGNVVDMAVGIIIGAAFGKIVTSLVNDVIMLPLGALTGGVDFSDLAIKIPQAGKEDLVVLRYGAFLSTVLDFLIVALAIFAVVKLMNMLRHQPPVAPPPPPKQEVLLAEIRDLLKGAAVRRGKAKSKKLFSQSGPVNAQQIGGGRAIVQRVVQDRREQGRLGRS